MYLPALDGFFDESVACLFRPSLVADDFLADPPRRIAQMNPEARPQLKIKLARYWARVDVARDQFELHERNEEWARSDAVSPSVYDSDPETPSYGARSRPVPPLRVTPPRLPLPPPRTQPRTELISSCVTGRTEQHL